MLSMVDANHIVEIKTFEGRWKTSDKRKNTKTNIATNQEKKICQMISEIRQKVCIIFKWKTSLCFFLFVFYCWNSNFCYLFSFCLSFLLLLFDIISVFFDLVFLYLSFSCFSIFSLYSDQAQTFFIFTIYNSISLCLSTFTLSILCFVPFCSSLSLIFLS